MLIRQIASLSIVVALISAGCGSPSSSTVDPPEGTAEAGQESRGAPEATVEVLLEPFDPPSWEELNANVQWVDRRVVDPRVLLRQSQSQEEAPLSVQEALALRNNTPEVNDRISRTMARLPESDGDVDWDASVVRHIAGDVKSTNALLYTSVSEGYVYNLLQPGFFGFDWTLEPLALADTVVSWQSSGDGLYDKLVIRDDLTWSDGAPLTAHDIVFSFQTIMNPEVPIPAVRTGTDRIKWVHAYDDFTVVYFHKESMATNIWNVNFPIVPKHIYEEAVEEDPTLQNSELHVKLESEPVTAGPYVLTKRVQGQELVFARRESYFTRGGKQLRPYRHFKEVRLRKIEDPNTSLLALRAGDIDELELMAEQWMTEQTNNDDFYSRNTKVTGLEWTEFHFKWNCASHFFSDKRVRWAMTYAFDHEEMLKKINYDLYQPASGTFHETAWMAPENYPRPVQQDLDRAEELLDEAGWDDSDGDGIRDKMIGNQLVKFEFSVATFQKPERIKTCELLKLSLDQIGIICHVKPMEFTVLIQTMRDRKFHAAFGGWSTGADPYTQKNIFGTGEDRNYGSYSNSEVDALYEQGLKEFDRAKRGQVYGRIHELLYEDQPYTWLYWRNSFYGFNKELRGYKFSPRGPYSYNPGFFSMWRPAVR